MKNSKIILLFLLAPVLLSLSFMDINAQSVSGSWSGSASLTQITIWELGGFRREKRVDVAFSDNVGSGTVMDNAKGKDGDLDCEGSGKAELHHLSINWGDSTCNIHITSPPCNGTASTYVAGQRVPYGPEITDIVISDKPWSNPNVLSGTETTVFNNGQHNITTTITWNLARPINVELIVTPEKYDSWLPEPGANELKKGSVINIALKVQGRNGRSASLKAKSFELRLSNTSKEPGITLNAPLDTSSKQLPDLRFLQHTIAESIKEDQFIKIPCNDGSTGKVIIGSYDGGGWTTLTVEAILEDKSRIKGSLLVPGGETEIPIPKRKPGTKIASSWLTANVTANGNPGEMDDKELSVGNNYPGDGLTAYEEYRGVISQGRFRRLDPRIKEVGIDVLKAELSFFSEGIKWFENATALTAVIFHEDLNEIDPSRRLNKNALTNHDYDQYVLRLYKSVIPGGGAMGKAYGGPATPAKTFAVVIDYAGFPGEYLFWQTHARTLNMPMPFTLKDLLANTIAHELGHGVNCWHHGPTKEGVNDTARAGQPIRIFDLHINEITRRPYPLAGSGMKGNQESGNLSCVMAYVPYCKWAYSKFGGTHFFYMTPILNVGKTMCINREGTGINEKDIDGINNYFGDATRGNCLAQIKLRD